MLQHHYMIEDLIGVSKAIAVFPLLLVIPGYVLGWMLGLFEFRGRSLLFRLALSLPLSISLCPILTYLGGRFASMFVVWLFYAATALAFLVMLVRGRRQIGIPKGAAAIAGVLAAWFAVSVFSLIDLQIGDRLYFPTNTFDYSVRSAFVHAITNSGVPPQSPFFQPGHPVILRYHYFWPMMCSLVNQAAGAAVTARHALIAGTFWCGVALLGLIAVALRVFVPSNNPDIRRRVYTAVLLAGITGFDILPTLFFLSLWARGLMSFVLPSGECWNEYVDWFLHTALWAPHALASCMAGFLSFLLVWHAPLTRTRTAMVAYSVAAGVALASAAGLSIWVALVFAAFFVVWTAITICRRWRGESLALILTGLTAILLVRPYLADLQGPGAGGPLLAPTVRAFSFTALVPGWPGMSQWTRLLVVNLPLIPLNYFLEFGFFGVAAWFKWRRYRDSGEPVPRFDLACGVLVLVSALLCTFLRSGVIGNNDLGWRGFLPAQLVLLLWAVDLFAGRDTLSTLTATQGQVLVVCMALGFAGSCYDLAITRFYPVLADRGVVPPIDWMSPDRDFGHRIYAARAAYQWVRNETAPTAAVQASPRVTSQDTIGMLYGDRPTVAADLACLTTFGGDPRQCPPVVAPVQAIFPETPSAAPARLRDVCQTLPIGYIVAKDTDAAWSNTQSWVWAERPAYANSYVRIFRCEGAHASP